MGTKERVLPSKDLLLWRRNFLSELKEVKPIQPQGPSAVGLAPGNTKTGRTGKLYKSVLVWNLPAVVTCPGASEWCLEHCYNADTRESVFPVKKWAENWWMSINQSQVLYDSIVTQLAGAEKPCAVRVHSSGDFFSESYIEFWMSLADAAQEISFWAYTRSWACRNLLPHLEKLFSMQNVELFASWDRTMAPAPPAGWRRSYVYTDPDAAEDHSRKERRVFICPEQTGRVDSCASCGFCMRRIDRDILFYFH